MTSPSAAEGPRVAGVETLYQGWGRFLRVAVRMPDGSEILREVEDHGEAAGVLAYDPDRRCAMLVRQLRAPMLLAGGHADTLETIAGCLEGEPPDACAIREAEEEAGLRLASVEPVAVVQTMPGISTERIHLYLARYAAADRVGPGGGLAAEAENITVAEVPLATLAAMADRGGLVDAKTLILVLTLRLRHPELFEP